MVLAVKPLRTVAFSALRVLELLQQKDQSNNSMLRSKERDLYRQLQRTRDRSRYMYELSVICIA